MCQQPEERFTYLFDRYYNRTATPKEIDEFLTLVEQTEDIVLEKHLSESFKSLQSEPSTLAHQKTEAIRHQILTSDTSSTAIFQVYDKKIFHIKWFAGISAAVLLFFSCWIYIQFTNQPHNFAKLGKHIAKPDILPGGNKAYLTLADGSKVVLDTIKPGTIARQGNMEIHKDATGRLTYTADKQKRNAPYSTALNKLNTPIGGQYKLILADGTKVWLNAASSLQFPVAFNGPTRSVTLTGEAYFEVSKNPDQPFLVKSGETFIKVLGTHFNIMSYENEAIKKTTLLEGSIEIFNSTNSFRVKPGEQVQILKQQLSQPKKVDTTQETAWKNGFFDFRDANIDYILRQVSRWYGVEVKYTGAIPKGLYTGRISRDVKISKLLEMLQYTGINYKLVNNTIIVHE